MANETLAVGALSVRFLVEADDSNGGATVFECYVPAGSRMPTPHSHAVFGSAYFREIGEAVAASSGGPPDMAAIGEVMGRHGLRPA